MTMSTILISFQQLMAGITGSMRAWLHSSAFWIYKLHQVLRPWKPPINLRLSPLKHNEHKCEIPNHQSRWQSSFSSGRRDVKSHHPYSHRWLFISMCSAHAVIVHSKNRFGLMAQAVEAISKMHQAGGLTIMSGSCTNLCIGNKRRRRVFFCVILPLNLWTTFGNYLYLFFCILPTVTTPSCTGLPCYIHTLFTLRNYQVQVLL